MEATQALKFREEAARTVSNLGFEAAVSFLQITAAELKILLNKDYEVTLAKKFLSEAYSSPIDVMTLSEFAGIEKIPSTGKKLDNLCPDTVAVLDQKSFGIELTAYSDDESLNAVRPLTQLIFDTAANCAEDFKDLQGLTIGNVSLRSPSGLWQNRRRREFVLEFFDFIREMVQQEPLAVGESRRIPKMNVRSPQRPFANHKLLEDHLQNFRIAYSGEFAPVSISPDNCGRHLGTSPEQLTKSIERKCSSVVGAYRDGLDEIWLLIHADGNPASSRVSPLFRSDVSDLLASNVQDCAKTSGFDRVYIWDAVRSGFVELISGDLREGL